MESSSWVRAMFETGIRLKKQHGAEKVCDFSLGNPDLEPPVEFIKAIHDIMTSDIPNRHGYMPNGGYPWVRSAIAGVVSSIHRLTFTEEHIVMSCGAAGGLNSVLKSILNPGDSVLTCTPCFMEYRAYADNHGGVLRTVPGKKNFDLDVEALEKAVDGTTAAVIINSPNNPSGVIYPEATLNNLGEMLERKSEEIGRVIYLIDDEPYRKIVYGDREIPSVFACYKNSIIVSSYSKELSIPGERIGWVAVHPDAEDGRRLVDAVILCTRILGFVNAPGLMQRAVQLLTDVQVNIEPYRKRRLLLCEGLSDIGYEFVPPDGTFYLFPKAPGGDDLAFVEALQEELILTVPGRGFGAPGYFRIAFCVDESFILKAMDGFRRVFAKFS